MGIPTQPLRIHSSSSPGCFLLLELLLSLLLLLLWIGSGESMVNLHGHTSMRAFSARLSSRPRTHNIVDDTLASPPPDPSKLLTSTELQDKAAQVSIVCRVCVCVTKKCISIGKYESFVVVGLVGG